MRFRNWFLFLMLALLGCSPSESAIQTAISSTQTAFPTNTPLPTSTPNPNEILDTKGTWMRLVPAGDVMLGNENGLFDERPVHKVFLDAYYIDKYEVSNIFYKSCVDEGACNPPKNSSSFTHIDYYGNPDFNLFPVLYVDFDMAKAYCEWRGAKLPTEAQWEKAARGTDERTFPWGEEIIGSVANYASIVGDTTKINDYENGKSPFGVYNMAGNVWEWVADWYLESYYHDSPASNPSGPISGSYRILRGGSWQETNTFTRTTFRAKVYPTYAYYNTGFRCAKNVIP